MTTAPDLLQAQKVRMLDRFYGLFTLFCLMLLGVGVPFVFYRKLTSAALICLVIGGIWLARRMSRNGKPERSLMLFSMGLWVVLLGLLYGGLPPNGAGIALATVVMLAVVVNNRTAILFFSTYLLMWLGYIALVHYQLAPPPFFASLPLVAWLLVFGAFWLILIPIPEMVRALNEGTSRQRSVLEATSDAILVVNSAGAVDSYNQKFVSIWGVPHNLLAQGNDTALLNFVVSQLADPPAFIQRVNDLYAHPEQSSFDTLQLKDKRVIERFSHPNRIHGQVVGRVWSFRDVTERHKAKQELQSSQAKLQGLFDLSPLGMSRNGMDGVFYEVNPAFTRMLGYSLDELNSMSYWDITPQDYADQEAIQLDNLRTRGGYGPYEKEYIHKDGHRFPVRLNGIQIQDAQGEAYIWSIIEDISEQKAHELKLTEARKVAEDASAAKGQFLANMSHEIRTPMNGILGLLSLLRNTELTALQLDYTSKTEESAQSLLGLLNDILDFSKIEAGKITLENEPFRIDRLLRKVAVVLSANVGNKNIEVLFDIDPALPEAVRGDAMRLQQVLINLGGNAVKFTFDGQVVLALRKLGSTPQSVRVEFSVRDSGIGIAPEHQAHIFSGFSQAEGSTTRRFGGTGLGLAISKRYVELMGGDIHVTSALGTGSTFAFVVELPVVVDIPQELVTPERSVLAPRRVLVVDDNPIAGALTVGMVQSWGWGVERADSGASALSLITAEHAMQADQFPFPLIFMDLQMPEMDGWETTRRIRQFAQQHQLAQPMIIVLTSHERDALAQRSESEQNSLNGFLVKPITASMLLDAVMEAGAGQGGLRKVTRGRSSQRQLNGMRILVVEDNLINQQVAEGLLSAEGALVSLAANGRLGADAVAAAAPQFDVVLMDIQMPVLDGYGATQVIREELGLRQLPIIAMTANAMASDRAACLAGGMDEHIGKPFDIAKLVSLLIRITGLHPRDENTASGDAMQAALPQSLPQIPGLDVATALARMSGMRSLYVRTAQDFSKILGSFTEELRSRLLGGDTKAAMMLLHTLKGNAGTLGATDLAHKAATLESICKVSALEQGLDDLGELEVLIQVTQARLAQVIVALQSADLPPPPPANAPVNMPVVISALRELAALAGASNMVVLQRFAELRDVLAPLPDRFSARLEQALQQLDLEAVNVLCSTKLAQLDA